MSLVREIGRVITHWAALETVLNLAVYAALNVDPKRGPRVVKEPREHQRLDLISDLLAMRGLGIHKKRLATLRKDIEDASVWRNALAHGAWVKEEKTNDLRLRLTSGSWQPERGMRGTVTRLLKPEGVPFTVEDCRALHEAIRSQYERVVVLLHAIQKMPELPPQKSA